MNHEKLTIHILNKFGIDERYKGYNYIISSIAFINQNGTDMLPITKFLYADVAKLYNTSKECVERDIRIIINHIWNQSENTILIAKIFGQENISKRLSNSSFLLLLYKHISICNTNELMYSLFKERYNLTCPISGTVCEFSDDFIRKIIYETFL